MFNPNKINNQIIKNHNKKIKDIPDGKFFNVRPKPIILSSRPMMKTRAFTGFLRKQLRKMGK